MYVYLHPKVSKYDVCVSYIDSGEHQSILYYSNFESIISIIYNGYWLLFALCRLVGQIAGNGNPPLEGNKQTKKNMDSFLWESYVVSFLGPFKAYSGIGWEERADLEVSKV